jgi:hypothetical protein
MLVILDAPVRAGVFSLYQKIAKSAGISNTLHVMIEPERALGEA